MSTLHRPLFSLVRDGYEEILVHGEIAVSFAPNEGVHIGVNGSYPARSLLKPFQFLAAGLPVEEWRGQARYAAAVGSVSATPEQVKQLLSWHQGSSLLKALKVPAMYPMDDLHRASLRVQKKVPEQCFHTCFSKHLAILRACELHGWPMETYLEIQHPFFDRLSGLLMEWLDLSEPLATVTDGCGLPSPVLRITKLAELYRKFVAAEGPQLHVADLMLQHPEWIGGPGRFDTRVMQLNHPGIVSKEGADGLWAMAIRPSARYPQGCGIVLKLAPGYHPTLAKQALRKLANQLNFEIPGEVPAGQSIVFHYTIDR